MNRMKKITLLIAGAMIAGALSLPSCKSPGEKLADANEEMNEAQKRLEEAKNDSIAAEKEWLEYRVETRKQIVANRNEIAELRKKRQAKGVVMDPTYEDRIVKLEEKNQALEAKLNDYEKYHSDWEVFKREFNHDMEELGKALKDITVDDVK
jgi:hypothetical protein